MGARDGDDLRIPVWGLRPIVEQLARAGVDSSPLLAEVGIDPALFDRSDATVSLTSTIALWELAPAACADEAFGLHAAEGSEIDRLGIVAVINYLASASDDMGTALTRVNRYLNLLPGPRTYDLTTSGDEAIWSIGSRSARTPNRHALEYSAAMMLRSSRRDGNAAFRPIEVCFQHGAPRDSREHIRIFDAPVRFVAEFNGMRFDGRAMALQPRRADPVVAATLEKALAVALPSSDGLVDRVRRRIGERLRDGPPSLDAFARDMGMSARTLQRRLADDGESYQSLVDDLRRRAALEYLERSDFSVAEIAYLIGFSDLAAFHHAFKRWTGRTPGSFRRIG
jgi:AraC-like DNA-binding protein